MPQIEPDDESCWARWYILTSGRYIHEQIKDALTDAGFDVRYIEKHEIHDNWEVKLKRGTAVLDPNYKTALRQIRKILWDVEICIERDAINLVQTKDRVYLTFIHTGGVPQVYDALNPNAENPCPHGFI